jgi:hypothetical protein
MMAIKLAGNLISGIPVLDYGHLQLVNTNTGEEIEVQSENSSIFGNWFYPESDEQHSNTPQLQRSG